MFAVIYRGYLKVGREAEYRQAWSIVARYFVEQCGALGSSLHRADDGLWVAYSRWPDKKTRDAAWPSADTPPSTALPSLIREAILTIKDCNDQDRRLPDICMEVVEDLLTTREVK